MDAWNPNTPLSIEAKLIKCIEDYDISLHQAVAKLAGDKLINKKALRKFDYTLESVRRNHLIKAWIDAGKYAGNQSVYESHLARINQINTLKSLYDQMDKMDCITAVQLLTAMLSALLLIHKFYCWGRLVRNEAHERVLDMLQSCVLTYCIYI